MAFGKSKNTPEKTPDERAREDLGDKILETGPYCIIYMDKYSFLNNENIKNYDDKHALAIFNQCKGIENAMTNAIGVFNKKGKLNDGEAAQASSPLVEMLVTFRANLPKHLKLSVAKMKIKSAVSREDQVKKIKKLEDDMKKVKLSTHPLDLKLKKGLEKEPDKETNKKQ